MNTYPQKLILGSGSPRRKEILSLADIPFEVKVSQVEESFDPKTPVEKIPELLAVRKAHAVQEKFKISNATILTADTMVLLGQEAMGKPHDTDEAISILLKLSGKTHRVLSGVCILENQVVQSFTETTFVTFSTISRSEIAYYVEKYRPFDKAGAYAIQEWIGVKYIQKIEGCYYNVMGLPLSRIVREMRW